MTDSRTLQPVEPDPARVRLAALEAQVSAREADLARVKNELLRLQSEYFREVGALHDRLGALDAEVADLEVRMGLRAPLDEGTEGHGEAEGQDGNRASAMPGCSDRGRPSQDLKRVFRDIAKAIHPDRASRGDDRARFRRHSLMAEANRAYADRDEDRLRLILQSWERSPDSVIGDDPDADRQRVGRRMAELDGRLIAIDVELADLRASAIGQLKAKIDAASAQGWDLYAEIVSEVRRQIARSSARAASLRGLLLDR